MMNITLQLVETFLRNEENEQTNRDISAFDVELKLALFAIALQSAI